MEKLNIAVCDDDPVFRGMLICKLKDYSSKTDIDLNIVDFSNGLELIISEIKYNLIFLDYKMGIMNGLETAKKLRSKGTNCPIIFVTSFNEIVYEVFEVNAFRFLKKPIEVEALNKALDDFIMQYKNRKIITFTSNGNTISVAADEIMYVEGKGRGCLVHTKDDVYPVLQVLSLFSEAIPNKEFFRCHRLFCVNMKYVSSFDGHNVILSNGDSIKMDIIKHSAFKRFHSEFLERCV